MKPGDWARVYRAMAAECDRIAAEQSAERRDWIDQAASQLGRKRHCSAVRRRVGAGQPGAAIVGRRFLLSVEAHSEELSSATRKPEAPATVADELRTELKLVSGGNR